MPESILCTAEVPAFDPATGQVAVYSHHLVSAPNSIAAAYNGRGTLVFGVPPAHAYGSANTLEPEAGDEGGGRQRKRRRLRQAPDASSTPADWIRYRERQAARHFTSTDHESDSHHAVIAPRLQSAIDAVRTEWTAKKGQPGWTGRKTSAWEWRGDEDDDDNAKEELNLVALAGTAAPVETDFGPLLLPDGATCDRPASECAGRIVVNGDSVASEQLALVTEEGNRLATALIPPSSGFLLSDMTIWSDQRSGLARLGREKGGWDLLLIDPPWPNASATRSSTYETFDPYDLWKLDIPALLGDHPAVVAVWLTNRVKFRRLVKDKLFPPWKVRHAVEWYWIKIASESGEPVWPLDTKHRRCYEGLLIGRYIPDGNDIQAPPSPAIPDGKVFLSTPIGHSRKPFILDLLRPYLSRHDRPPNILELFARMTLAGPTVKSPPDAAAGSPEPESDRCEFPFRQRGFFCACGNEAIKFNIMQDEASEGVRGWIRVPQEEGG